MKTTQSHNDVIETGLCRIQKALEQVRSGTCTRRMAREINIAACFAMNFRQLETARELLEAHKRLEQPTGYWAANFACLICLEHEAGIEANLDDAFIWILYGIQSSKTPFKEGCWMMHDPDLEPLFGDAFEWLRPTKEESLIPTFALLPADPSVWTAESNTLRLCLSEWMALEPDLRDLFESEKDDLLTFTPRPDLNPQEEDLLRYLRNIRAESLQKRLQKVCLYRGQMVALWRTGFRSSIRDNLQKGHRYLARRFLTQWLAFAPELAEEIPATLGLDDFEPEVAQPFRDLCTAVVEDPRIWSWLSAEKNERILPILDECKFPQPSSPSPAPAYSSTTPKPSISITISCSPASTA